MGTASAVLLLSEATMLAMVALAAIVIVALVVLALVMARPMLPSYPPPSMAPPVAQPVAQPVVAATPQPLPQPLPRIPIRSSVPGRTLEIDVPTKHVDDFMIALRASGWRVHETGEVVATDEDEEALTTVLVDVPQATAQTVNPDETR